jgi:hypothetical protein
VFVSVIIQKYNKHPWDDVNGGKQDEGWYFFQLTRAEVVLILISTKLSILFIPSICFVPVQGKIPEKGEHMSRQVSFTKHERKILPDFRKKINNAESTEDVKKFFIHTIDTLLEDIFPEKMAVENDDVRLVPDKNPPFELSKRLKGLPEFVEVWQDSDLSNVFGRLAETAAHRYLRLDRHPEKTDSKRQRRYENR